jgi:hypothetical protein
MPSPEAVLIWIKASRSYGKGECVEVADNGGAVLMRDSKDPDGARLRFTKPGFAALLRAAADGALDHLIDD